MTNLFKDFHQMCDNEKLQAENAALKEQVAQLTSTIKHAEQMEDMDKKELTTLQSKSAALVDALEGLLSLDEENHQRYPGDEDVCLEVRNARAALAAFKGEK